MANVMLMIPVKKTTLQLIRVYLEAAAPVVVLVGQHGHVRLRRRTHGAQSQHVLLGPRQHHGVHEVVFARVPGGNELVCVLEGFGVCRLASVCFQVGLVVSLGTYLQLYRKIRYRFHISLNYQLVCTYQK